jgi:bifunctional DNA-binding transcriptional regulator/antitoxin component of YhaV-PrlF toxin-antitoxin module
MTVATTLVTMDAEGHLTLPEELRQLLQADETTFLLAEAGEGGVILRPIPAEDAWAYTPENLQKLEAALADLRDGRVQQLSKGELEQIIADAR